MGIAEWWRNRGRDLARYPQDENGDVLWQMHKNGDDLSKKRIMDFSFLFPSQDGARAFQRKVEPRGFKVEVSFFEKKRSWDVQCSIETIPSHRQVSEIEAELSRLASTEGGKPDGWGCLAQ